MCVMCVKFVVCGECDVFVMCIGVTVGECR